MMLFEAAMPLTLHSNKRKSFPSDVDQPLPKKRALEHPQASKYERRLQESVWNRDLSDSGLVLANGVHVKQIASSPISSEPSAEKQRTASSKKELPVRSHCTEARPKKDSKQGIHGNGIDQEEEFVGSKETAVEAKKSKYGMNPHSKTLASLLKDEKFTGSSSSSSKSQTVGSVLYEPSGYMRRMASLNASACVTAMMEPEKKFMKPRSSSMLSGLLSKSHVEQHLRRSTSSSSSEEHASPWVSPVNSMQQSLRPSSSSLSPTRYLKLSTSSSSSDSSKESDDFEGQPELLSLLAVAALAGGGNFELEDIPYNTLGLLCNGDTLHPNTRVFYNSDVDLTVPDRVIPRVVPSQKRFVRSAIADALTQRHVGKKRKAAKANNGWMPLGNPIKALEYKEGPTTVVRRYYAGIKRNSAKEVICIRDCIIIRSGDAGVDEKPYVAKIASIWQEQPGRLMMTVFWYYRPHELDSIAVQGLSFQKGELLGSQHHDDNSVACIEEKCYILGVSQYSRYQAYIQSTKDQCILKHRAIVPKSSRDNNKRQPSFLRIDASSEGRDMSLLSELTSGDNFESLTTVEPELVFLCYRGYNHCAAKVVSKFPPK